MNIWQYLKSPQHIEGNEKLNWKRFFKLYFLLLFICITAQLIIKTLIDIPNPDVLMDLKSWTKWKRLFYLVLLIPAIEETIFRLWLKNKNYNYLISLTVIISYIVYSFFKYRYAIMVIDILFFIVLLTILACRYIQDFQVKYFKYIFYFSCLLFGIMHIINFDNFQTIELYKIPLFTMPQIIAGFFLGYIRMNYGFIYGLLFHYMVNFVTVILLMR